MVKAIWNGTVIAESEHTEQVEGNHYFPPDNVNRELLIHSETQTTCPWKGMASYYTVKVKGQENSDSAWYYPEPKEAAFNIKDHIAFWKGIEIVE